MKSLEIIGFKRANLGKKESKDLRLEGNVPCVLYGGKEQVHFHSPMILFRDLVYTPDTYMVDLNIEGDIYKCTLQDIQFHPVSEAILHADFLLIVKGKPVKMDIPIKFEGDAPGVMAGGKLIMKLRKVTLKALPKDMPDYITVDISKLALGKSVKVGEIKPGDFEILNNPATSIATVEIPRALRGKQAGVEEE